MTTIIMPMVYKREVLRNDAKIFLRSDSAPFFCEDFHPVVLAGPYFGIVAVCRVGHQFFVAGRTLESFAGAGREGFSVKH